MLTATASLSWLPFNGHLEDCTISNVCVLGWGCGLLGCWFDEMAIELQRSRKGCSQGFYPSAIYHWWLQLLTKCLSRWDEMISSHTEKTHITFKIITILCLMDYHSFSLSLSFFYLLSFSSLHYFFFSLAFSLLLSSFPFFLGFLLVSSFANMPLFNNHQEAKFTSYAIKIYEVRGLVWWQDVRFQKINLKLTWQDCDWTFEHCVEF